MKSSVLEAPVRVGVPIYSYPSCVVLYPYIAQVACDGTEDNNPSALMPFPQ